MNPLAPCYERASGQVIFRGPPTGVAGEASIEPVPGLELAFDRADGRLCWAVADTVAQRPVAFNPQVAAMLTRLLGSHALDVALSAVASPGDAPTVWPDPELAGTLSSLARLQAAQATSPVPAESHWWAAEAFGLAEDAGLASQAAALASRALPGLLRQLDRSDWSALPEQAVRAARRVAQNSAATHPEAARRLTAICDFRSPAPLARPIASRPVTGLDVVGEVTLLREERSRSGGPQRLLDPDRVPAGLFRFGLSPRTDLFVRRNAREGRSVTVIAALAPGADRDALSRCVARLVDPPVRRVVAQESFVVAGSRAIAELELNAPLEEWPKSWVEVTGDKHQPVRSAHGHWASRAKRWADAALRAERAPTGIDSGAAPSNWAALAAAAWDMCRQDWLQAGDDGRAWLAVGRQAAIGAEMRDRRSSAVIAGLPACRAAVDHPCYLAELVGC